jgi:hypothetical protein
VFAPGILVRRFHGSIEFWECRSCFIRYPIEANKLSSESSRKVGVPHACDFWDLSILARRAILLAPNRCRTLGFTGKFFGTKGGHPGLRK